MLNSFKYVTISLLIIMFDEYLLSFAINIFYNPSSSLKSFSLSWLSFFITTDNILNCFCSNSCFFSLINLLMSIKSPPANLPSSTLTIPPKNYLNFYIPNNFKLPFALPSAKLLLIKHLLQIIFILAYLSYKQTKLQT